MAIGLLMLRRALSEHGPDARIGEAAMDSKVTTAFRYRVTGGEAARELSPAGRRVLRRAAGQPFLALRIALACAVLVAALVTKVALAQATKVEIHVYNHSIKAFE